MDCRRIHVIQNSSLANAAYEFGNFKNAMNINWSDLLTEFIEIYIYERFFLPRFNCYRKR